MSPEKEVFIDLDVADIGRRFDALVAERLPECSRAMAARLIRQGHLKIGNHPKKPAYRLHPGDRIVGRIPPPTPVSFIAEPIPLDVLFEDAHLIVLNKPCGMVVHPSPGHASGTLVNALLARCPDLQGIGGELRPGIVHRLDKDTTGVLAVAKTTEALAKLASQFKARTVRKSYLALVHWEMKADAGRIDLPLGRHPVERKRMAVLETGGKTARTDWSVVRRLPESSLLEVRIQTGRTHQIRVHCKAIHHPVVGDPVYCTGKAVKRHSAAIQRLLDKALRQMLHAWRLWLRHPVTDAQLSFEAPIPQDMTELIHLLEKELRNGTRSTGSS